LQPDSGITWEIKDGGLSGSPKEAGGASLRWAGGFNPFATYDLVIRSAQGDGSAGMKFLDASNGTTLTASLDFKDGKPATIAWQVTTGGKQVIAKDWPVPAGTSAKDLTLRAQMSAVGVNLLLESSGTSVLVGHSDFAKHLDLREREKFQRMDFAIATELKPGASLLLDGASSALTPGSGQADIRAITDEEGAPLLDEGRLWFTITVRGRGLPHPLQGVFSLDPSVFDLRFEGIIVFDMSDGLLRNELASHLFRDTKSGEWRGWTTGFSALGGTGKGEATPFSPPSGPPQRLFQGPPAKSKFLAAPAKSKFLAAGPPAKSKFLATPFSPPSGPPQRLFQGPPAKSKFLAASQRYTVIRGAVGDPDPFRVRYRQAIADQVAEIIRSRCDRREAVARLRRWAEASLIEADRKRFVAAAEETLAGIHEGNFARYRVRPSEFEAWREMWG
jgi:hypothetical protein